MLFLTQSTNNQHDLFITMSTTTRASFPRYKVKEDNAMMDSLIYTAVFLHESLDFCSESILDGLMYQILKAHHLLRL